MKLFKQLLVAPAALGLLAPMAAGATEVNVAGVSDYASVSADTVANRHIQYKELLAVVHAAEEHGDSFRNRIVRFGDEFREQARRLETVRAR